MIDKNIRYLVDLSGLKQKNIALKLGVTENTFSRWCTGTLKPGFEAMQNIGNFFSETLNVPLNFFRNGRALEEDDFEQTFTARGLPSTDQAHDLRSTYSASSGENPPPDRQSFEPYERRFMSALSQQSGTPGLPVPESALQILLELSALTGGVGTHNQSGFTKALRGLSHVRATFGERAETDSADSENDKK